MAITPPGRPEKRRCPPHHYLTITSAMTRREGRSPTALARRDLAFLTDEIIGAFWAKVEGRSTEQDKWGREPCWAWLGSAVDGRGLFSFKVEGRRRVVFAHHAAYFLRVGEVLEDQRLFRLCDSDIACVNPAHWGLAGASQSFLGSQSPPPSLPSLPGKDPLFSQGDLRNIRTAAERTALGRDAAAAEDRQLTPAEAYLVELAEKILETLPEDALNNYRLVAPGANGSDGSGAESTSDSPLAPLDARP